MKFGFLIDHRKCIGCHACSVACKEEHQVPLGVYRTWVKYVEKGAFPNTRRHFTVLRCNHCEDAPCVTICPVTALYKRSDGIVDFNPNTCIGCKACMQACPYDALYIDPNSNTAAKCNFCAHRVEVGLQPSCQIVCPTQAIVSGDLDDPTSLISYLTAREPIRVRKPEKGTKPQLSYIDADESSLTPGATIQPQGFGMWSQVTNPQVTDLSMPFWSGTMTAPIRPGLAPGLERRGWENRVQRGARHSLGQEGEPLHLDQVPGRRGLPGVGPGGRCRHGAGQPPAHLGRPAAGVAVSRYHQCPVDSRPQAAGALLHHSAAAPVALLVDHWLLYSGGVWRSARSQFLGRALRGHQFPPFPALAGRAGRDTRGDLYRLPVWAGQGA